MLRAVTLMAVSLVACAQPQVTSDVPLGATDECGQPTEGCPCRPDARPVACWLDEITDDEGAVLCREGTRTCRDGAWSGCESIRHYPMPERPESITALLDPKTPAQPCPDKCDIHCFMFTNQLDPAADGSAPENSTDLEWAQGGGLTLGTIGGGGGPPPPPPPMNCVVGSGVGDDNDCDGVPNDFDVYPDERPFGATNPAIFLSIPAGETRTGKIDLDFKVHSADVYFLVDQSGSMSQEREALKASLTTGDYINDPAYQCADFDLDGQPNNEQKQKGIIGAIRCKIRDANFGVGFFREVPFTPSWPDMTTLYANDASVAYENSHDISDDVDSVLAAVNRLTTVENIDVPESSMIALHQILVPNGMYFGKTKRGVLPRTDCPVGTWGYPCFRTGAIPIIVMLTDAPFHNGPPLDTSSTQSHAYSSNPALKYWAGTETYFNPVDSTSANRNDTFAKAKDLGNVGSVYRTYTGTTQAMAANVMNVGCGSLGDGKDAVFKFRLTAAKRITIETSGSDFDTVIGLYNSTTGAPIACNNDDRGPVYNTSKLAANLMPNVTYYVVLKGANANAHGYYQLSIGDETRVTSATYTPPTWATTLANIKAKGAHVISILSCRDDDVTGPLCPQTKRQAEILAVESKALGPGNTKLVLEVDRDGAGMSSKVVEAVSSLANHLAMNVKARVVFNPDPNPGFTVTVRAVDDPEGDGCEAGVVGTEHQHCMPGATPRFELNFANPAGAPVPVNPNDEYGGYEFRAELIGNNQFIVDQVPIYVIPEPAAVPEPPPGYYAKGEFSKDTVGSTCGETERPDWSVLTWSADVYQSTSVTFSMCTADTEAGLDTCTPHPVAVVTGTTACTSTSDCAKGFCDRSVGVCQVVTGRTCTHDNQCASHAYCDLGPGLCTYHGQPAMTGDALGADNFKPYLRTTVVLRGTTPFPKPPIVRSWQTRYECHSVL